MTTTESAPSRKVTPLLEGLQCVELAKRGLSLADCEEWGYATGIYAGKPVQVATYRKAVGPPVCQKIRFANKDFLMLGDAKNPPLFGMHKWRDGGKMVVVTEGEIDAISVSKMQQHKWPVVSLPNGAQAAKQSFANNIEWLEKFDKVILMFDNDAPGIAAAKEAALVLTPGKAFIATLPLKDANDMLRAGRGAEVIKAMWDAKAYRPDGIIDSADLWDSIVNAPNVPSIPYPWQGMQDITQGCREGEIVCICAGSGIGKSAVCAEVVFPWITGTETVGYIALEESTKRTAMRFMGLYLGRTIHLDSGKANAKELKEAYDATLGTHRLYLYDHFGSTDTDNLLAKIRYLIKGCGCKTIILDHVSIVVSGIEEGEERRVIDNLMTKLRTLVQETQCRMIIVSHLKRPQGTGHEEGAQTSLSQLRGSAAIGQLSDMVIGLERNQQDPTNKNVTLMRILKNRWTGETGEACTLLYNPNTGRITESNVASGFSQNATAPPVGVPAPPANEDF